MDRSKEGSGVDGRAKNKFDDDEFFCFDLDLDNDFMVYESDDYHHLCSDLESDSGSTFHHKSSVSDIEDYDSFKNTIRKCILLRMIQTRNHKWEIFYGFRLFCFYRMNVGN